MRSRLVSPLIVCRNQVVHIEGLGGQLNRFGACPGQLSPELGHKGGVRRVGLADEALVEVVDRRSVQIGLPAVKSESSRTSAA